MKRIWLSVWFLGLCALLWAREDPVSSLLYLHKQGLVQHKLPKTEGPLQTLSQSETDAQYYEIHLTPDYDAKTIRGIVRARFRVRSASLTLLWLDLQRNMRVQSVSGAAVSFQQTDDFLQLTLRQTYFRNDTLTVEITYTGQPSAEGFGYFSFDTFTDGSPMIWTLSEPYGAKYWWPCKDTPGDKADSVDMFITVPAEQVAASNGMLVSVTPHADGSRTFHWRERYPIATYLVAATAGPFAHFQDFYHFSAQDSMLLDYYVYPDYLSTAKDIFPQMQDYLDALIHYFGPYPFSKEKYGMIQFGRTNGAMEHQTLTSIGKVAARWKFVYVHELAHQWFGDAVTCASWQDIWLNEGFASYSEALYAEWGGYNGLPAGEQAYHAYMAKQRYTDGGTVQVADTSSLENIFARVVYYKGSWILHMLRHVVGDAVFFDILKSYWQDARRKYGTVRTEDFISVCEAKSGKNLHPFFEQWLKRPSYPQYQFDWNALPDGDPNGLELIIRQTQYDRPYMMPIDIKITLASGKDTTLIVENSQEQQRYAIYLNEPPVAVVLDPEEWILRDVQTPGSINPDLISFENIFPNPFRETLTILIKSRAMNVPGLQIYDRMGRRIKRLQSFREFNQTYLYEWDGRNENGNKAATGLYFVRPVLRQPPVRFSLPVRKVVLLR